MSYGVPVAAAAAAAVRYQSVPVAPAITVVRAVPAATSVAAAEHERPSLFMGGLPRKWTADDVKKCVEDTAGKPGSVQAVHMKCGYCFVDFKGDSAFCTAVGEKVAAKLDGRRVSGHILGVRLQTAENHQWSLRELHLRKLNKLASKAEKGPPPLIDDDATPAPQPTAETLRATTPPVSTASTVASTLSGVGLVQPAATPLVSGAVTPAVVTPVVPSPSMVQRVVLLPTVMQAPAPMVSHVPVVVMMPQVSGVSMTTMSTAM